MKRKPLLIAGGTALLIIIAAAVLLITKDKPLTAADYKAAEAPIATLGKRTDATRTAIANYSSGRNAGKKPSPDAFNASVSAYQQQAELVADLPVMRDAAVQKSYQAFKAKADTYIASEKALITDYPLYQKVVPCTDDAYDAPATLVDQYTKLYKSCQSNVTKLQHSASTSYQLYANAVNAYMPKQLSLFKQLEAAYAADDIATQDAIGAQLKQNYQTTNIDSATYNASINKIAPGNAFRDLYKAVSAKAK